MARPVELEELPRSGELAAHAAALVEVAILKSAAVAALLSSLQTPSYEQLHSARSGNAAGPTC